MNAPTAPLGSSESPGPSSTMAPPSHSVIQTHFTSSQHGVVAPSQPGSQAGGGGGPTMAPVRVQTPGPSDTTTMDATFNGTNRNTGGPTLVAANGASKLTPTTSSSSGLQHTPLVNHGPHHSLTGSPHIIRAETPRSTTQAAPHRGSSPGSVAAPRNTSAVALAPSPGAAVRPLTPQLLAPRQTPQTPPGQPGVQNFQLPPGMVLVRSESGQLLMIHQQALAQMQAQAAPRHTTPSALHTPAQVWSPLLRYGAPCSGTEPPAQVRSPLLRYGAPCSGPWHPPSSRNMAPGSVVRQGSPGATPVPPTTTLHRPPVLQETMENVKKCRNFLSALIKLASTGKQSAETADHVRDLVKKLLEGELEPEDFTSKLYSELNSSPQPYLVPFLKRSIPALRQLTPNAAAFRPAESRLPASCLHPSLSQTSPLPGHGGPEQPRPSPRPRGRDGSPAPDPARPRQTGTHQPNAQPQTVVMRPQVTMATSPAVAPRNQSPGQIILGPQQLRQLTKGGPGSTGVLPVGKPAPPAALCPAQKNELREAGGAFKDDDDFNDVASMAGVNLAEESARILATDSELVGVVTRSCKDEAFLVTAALQRRMVEI
ncbi:hypothetical protein NHX12_016797, partial [Muraenolepis orangiensis]